MLFVALLSTKPNFTPAEALQRRMGWKMPEGTKPIVEYWLEINSPHVIGIFEADNIAPIMAAMMPWMDLFDCTVVPAVTAEDGMKLASQMMPKA